MLEHGLAGDRQLRRQFGRGRRGMLGDRGEQRAPGWIGQRAEHRAGTIFVLALVAA